MKRENPGNASLSQLLLTSPFGSDSCRFAHNDTTNNMEMEGSSAPAGQGQVQTLRFKTVGFLLSENHIAVIKAFFWRSHVYNIHRPHNLFDGCGPGLSFLHSTKISYVESCHQSRNIFSLLNVTRDINIHQHLQSLLFPKLCEKRDVRGRGCTKGSRYSFSVVIST